MSHKGQSATDDPNNPSAVADLPSASLASFEANVYEPMLKPYCTSCHASTFADSTPEAAHKNFLQRVSFNQFSGVDQTPVVLKLKGSHNCWEGETKKCVESMTNGINLWLLDLESMGYKPKPAVYPNATKSVLMSATVPATVAIDSTQYVGAGVDTATLATPFVKGTDDPDGAIGSYAMGMAGTPTVAAANQAVVTQTVTFNVDVKAAGTYQVWARIKTPAAEKNNFYVRSNNQTLNFDTPVTDAVWKWVQVTTKQGNNAAQNMVIQVPAPAVVPVSFVFRAAEAKISYVVLTTKTDAFDGEQFANKFMDIPVNLSIPGAKIIATVWEKTTEEGKRSLGVKELRIESTKPLHVKGIYPLINGLFHLNHGTYTLVDTIAGGSTDHKQQVINTGGSNSSTWLTDYTKDQLSFAFDVIEEVP